MILHINIGKTLVNINKLQEQIDALKEQGYDGDDNVPVDSFIKIGLGKDNQEYGATFKKIVVSMGWVCPDTKLRNENTIKVRR